jgi:hypothetical protein
MDGQWTFQSLLLQPLFPVFAQCLMWNSWLNVMTYLLDIQTLNCKKMFISWNSRLRCEENWSRQSTENGGRPKSCSLNFNQTRLPTHFDWQISHQLCTQLTTLANNGSVTWKKASYRPVSDSMTKSSSSVMDPCSTAFSKGVFPKPSAVPGLDPLQKRHLDCETRLWFEDSILHNQKKPSHT